MVKYKILCESLKETADHMAAIELLDDFKWSMLLKMMKNGEEMFESGESYKGAVLSAIVKAFGFSIACWGVLALVMHVIGG